MGTTEYAGVCPAAVLPQGPVSDTEAVLAAARATARDS